MAKSSFTLLLAVLLSLVAAVLCDEERYTSKYDDVDVDEILGNPRLRKQYENCYMGAGPCLTPDARFLKEKFPEVLVTKCRKCTDKQREFFGKVTTWYIENEPDTWEKIVRLGIAEAGNNRSTRSQ